MVNNISKSPPRQMPSCRCSNAMPAWQPLALPAEQPAWLWRAQISNLLATRMVRLGRAGRGVGLRAGGSSLCTARAAAGCARQPVSPSQVCCRQAAGFTFFSYLYQVSSLGWVPSSFLSFSKWTLHGWENIGSSLPRVDAPLHRTTTIRIQFGLLTFTHDAFLYPTHADRANTCFLFAGSSRAQCPFNFYPSIADLTFSQPANTTVFYYTFACYLHLLAYAFIIRALHTPAAASPHRTYYVRAAAPHLYLFCAHCFIYRPYLRMTLAPVRDYLSALPSSPATRPRLQWTQRCSH